MTVQDLNRDQLVELKQDFLDECLQASENRSPSYEELADADTIVPDDVVFAAYEGCEFSNDDFICSAGQEEDKTFEPVYKKPFMDAKANGECQQYNESLTKNIACRDAIDEAIASNYKDWCLDTKAALREVLDEFGPERVSFVLAKTISRNDWDGRYSPQNKAWAKEMGVPDDAKSLDYVINRAHPGLVNMLTSELRTELALENKKPGLDSLIQSAAQKAQFAAVSQESHSIAQNQNMEH